MQILTTVGLRYETTLDQLRFVLARIRELCLAHLKIDNDTIRIRFTDYGSSSLDIQIRIYALTRDWNEFCHAGGRVHRELSVRPRWGVECLELTVGSGSEFR